MPLPTFRPGDLIRIKHQPGAWKILTAGPTQGGGNLITATDLRAYPRIDIIIPASQAAHITQE